jgi:hypothetical protein
LWSRRPKWQTIGEIPGVPEDGMDVVPVDPVGDRVLAASNAAVLMVEDAVIARVVVARAGRLRIETATAATTGLVLMNVAEAADPVGKDGLH